MNFLKKFAKRIFQYEARLVLKKYKPKVIAISGSVGKTSAKEAIYKVLSKKFFVRKSEKSFTTELGVPLTIIGCHGGRLGLLELLKDIFFGFKLLLFKSSYPEWLILELDGDKPGDLRGISEWLAIDVLVLTAIGEVPAHIESFWSIEQFLFEKRCLIDAVKRDGVVVFNVDDSRTSQLLTDVEIKKVSCGIAGECDVRGSDYEILYAKNNSENVPTGMSFEITVGGEKVSLSIFESLGIQNEYASLIAIGVGLHLTISLKESVGALQKYRALPGRMNIIAGIKDTTIIDDSYNASPVAMENALDLFKTIKHVKRKIIMVGDMFELGRHSVSEHKKLAHKLKDISEYVYCVGLRARDTATELLALGFPENKLVQCDTSEEAGLELQKILEPGDLILVKGSQAMRMEKIVEEVMRHPEDKEKLLVRQEEEWKGR